MKFKLILVISLFILISLNSFIIYPKTDKPINKTKLIMPIKGFWLVSQGNNSKFSHNGRNKYAFDFVKVDIEGNYKESKAKKNIQHYSFNVDIIAPADGKIIKAYDIYADTKPGELKYKPSNQVLIDHGNGEYSQMFHFKKGGLKVKVGDYVKQGDVIGKGGNSGKSTAPHIHYALCKKVGGTYQSIPTAFEKLYIYDSSKKEINIHKSNIPKTGEIVSNYFVLYKTINKNQYVKNEYKNPYFKITRLKRISLGNLSNYKFSYNKLYNHYLDKGFSDDTSIKYLFYYLISSFYKYDLKRALDISKELEKRIYNKTGIKQQDVVFELPFTGVYKLLNNNRFKQGYTGISRYLYNFKEEKTMQKTLVTSPSNGKVIKMSLETVRNKKLDSYYPTAYMIIDHGFNEYSYIGHLDIDKLLVKEGSNVRKGTYLAEAAAYPYDKKKHIYFARIKKIDGLWISFPIRFSYVKVVKGLIKKNHQTGYIKSGEKVSR